MIHKVSLNPVRRYMIRKALLGTALCLSMLSQTVSSSAKVTDEPQQSMQTEQTQLSQRGQQNDEPQAGSAVTFGQLNANEVFV